MTTYMDISVIFCIYFCYILSELLKGLFSILFGRMESRETLPKHEYEKVRMDSDGGEATARDKLPSHEYENVRMDSDGGEATG